MSKPRVKTGQPREVEQPFNIDRLPEGAKVAIEDLRRVFGKTWLQIEELSALPFNPDWRAKGGGFVNWHDLPLSILELFPDMRLAKSSLHRWYDVRIQQVRQATMERAEQARVLAESFVNSKVDGDREATLHAVRDIFFGIISEDGTLASRAAAGKALLALAELQQIDRTNDIKERKVSADERKLKMMERREAIAISKLEKETEAVAKKVAKGEVTIEDINRIRERTFGLPPVRKEA